MAKAPVLPRGFELPLEPRLPRIGSIDQVAVEERAGTLAKRSIKREAKVFALELAVRMTDLTTLEGADTPGKVAALASKAVRPDPSDPDVPSVAAICVYPNLVPAAVQRVEGTGIKVASVATAFPSGQSPLDAKLDEVRWVVEHGADEVDMVIDRGAFLSGRYAKVYDEIVRVKEACGDAHLKVILEVAELGTYDNVRRASLLAMAAGADFIKTSTGKLPGAATLPVQLVMLEAIRDVHVETGRKVGMKPAGGVRRADRRRSRTRGVHELVAASRLRAVEVPVSDRAHPGRALARVRGAREPERRQADQGVARRRPAARGRALLLLRRLGRQARVRLPEPNAAAARRRRPDHPLELPAADALVEDRAGARDRQRSEERRVG